MSSQKNSFFLQKSNIYIINHSILLKYHLSCVFPSLRFKRVYKIIFHFERIDFFQTQRPIPKSFLTLQNYFKRIEIVCRNKRRKMNFLEDLLELEKNGPDPSKFDFISACSYCRKILKCGEIRIIVKRSNEKTTTYCSSQCKDDQDEEKSRERCYNWSSGKEPGVR
jgi:hypothetical protein